MESPTTHSKPKPQFTARIGSGPDVIGITHYFKKPYNQTRGVVTRDLTADRLRLRQQSAGESATIPTMIDPTNAHRLSDWLRLTHRPLLISHRRPDGDSIGALAAMSQALRALGKEPAIVLFDRFPPRYEFLRSSGEPWHLWEEAREVLSCEADAVIVLDTCSLSQLEPFLAFLASAPRLLVIDHHSTRDEIGTRPGDLRILDDTAGACCLILAEWVQETGLMATLPPPAAAALATALITGIATDCGWFRFSNTDARLLRVAADLIDAGADLSGIYDLIYQQEPAAKLRLIARMLGSLRLEAEGRLAVMELRAEDFAAAGADLSMTEDLVNEAARLRDTEAVLLFTEEPGGVVRVNLRSKRTLDVSEVARRYGGGGHTRAAGARLNGRWEYVVPRVVSEVLEAL
jgi:phosphoesterase RecJ-like protein